MLIHYRIVVILIHSLLGRSVSGAFVDGLGGAWQCPVVCFRAVVRVAKESLRGNQFCIPLHTNLRVLLWFPPEEMSQIHRGLLEIPLCVVKMNSMVHRRLWLLFLLSTSSFPKELEAVASACAPVLVCSQLSCVYFTSTYPVLV